MKLMPMQAKKLTDRLTKLKLPQATVTDYITEIQKTGSMKLKAIEIKIAEALSRQNPPRCGWTNTPDNAGSLLVEAGTGVIVQGGNGQPIIRTSKVRHDSKGPLMAETARPFIRDNEGSALFMYLDTAGKVTVGIGHLLPTAADAQNLPFIVRATKKSATAEEIAADFKKVKDSGKTNALSRTFKDITDLGLPESEINALFESDFKIHRDSIPSSFKLTTFPKPAQVAFVDLIYQVGITKFLPDGSYTKFKAALKRRDWPRAGSEADVNKPPTPGRNSKRKQKFMEAAKIEPFFTTSPKKTASLLQILLKL